MENLGEDFISKLPGRVTDNILGRLPLRDAVGTSILSKDWRYKWASIPDLVFDHTFEHKNLKKNLETIVYYVLLLHRGPINKFALHVPTYESNPDVNHWLYLLSDYEVKDLSLQFCWGRKHEIPRHFFKFQHLRHLELFRCVFKPPPEYEGFGSLVALDFQEVDFEPEIFGRFISKCVLLERLRIVGCTDWESVEIEGPCLRSFTFHGHFESIGFKNCPVLADVSLSTPIQGDMGNQPNDIVKYFDFLPTLEKVHLNHHLLQFLGAGDVPERLPQILNHLRVANLSMYLDSIKELAFALCLIRSSPNLKTLQINLYAKGIARDVVEYIRRQLETASDPNQNLFGVRRVKFANFNGAEDQMEFAKYVLACGGGLEEMVIAPAGDDGASLVETLSQFPRSSAAARIVVRTFRIEDDQLPE